MVWYSLVWYGTVRYSMVWNWIVQVLKLIKLICTASPGKLAQPRWRGGVLGCSSSSAKHNLAERGNSASSGSANATCGSMATHCTSSSLSASRRTVPFCAGASVRLGLEPLCCLWDRNRLTAGFRRRLPSRKDRAGRRGLCTAGCSGGPSQRRGIFRQGARKELPWAIPATRSSWKRVWGGLNNGFDSLSDSVGDWKITLWWYERR